MVLLMQYVDSSYCLRCQGCCRFREQHSVWSPQTIEPVPCGDGYVCPKLERSSNRCAVYKNRPLDCTLYPFLLHRSGGRVYIAVHRQCPFVQEHGDAEALAEYAAYLHQVFSKDPVRSFIRAHPELICAYPDEVAIIAPLEGFDAAA
jgi:hypothetical protein